MELRPLERRVLYFLSLGKTYEEMATIFKKSPEHLERVVGFMDLKMRKRRLSGKPR